MNHSAMRRLALIAVAAPLALGLAACNKESAGSAAPSGEKIALIAAPAGKAWSDVVSKTADGGYLMGNPQAPIKLVEFGALSCSHCAEFAHEASEELRTKYVDSGRVSFELRLFMLNALDPPAALLATCSAPEAVISLSDQFWAWQGEAFANLQKNQAVLASAEQLPADQRLVVISQAAGMDQFFASRGISLDQGKACLTKPGGAEALVKMSDEQGKKHNITGTPAFLLNGESLPTNTWPDIKARLETMGAR